MCWVGSIWGGNNTCGSHGASRSSEHCAMPQSQLLLQQRQFRVCIYKPFTVLQVCSTNPASCLCILQDALVELFPLDLSCAKRDSTKERLVPGICKYDKFSYAYLAPGNEDEFHLWFHRPCKHRSRESQRSTP